MTNNTSATAIAQTLQTRREEWKATLDSLPMPKGGSVKMPYESLQAAIADGFKLFTHGKLEGPDAAWSILTKGFKTIQWRKLAEKNRETRDDIADGDMEETEEAPQGASKARSAEEQAAFEKRSAAAKKAAATRAAKKAGVVSTMSEDLDGDEDGDDE